MTALPKSTKQLLADANSLLTTFSEIMHDGLSADAREDAYEDLLESVSAHLYNMRHADSCHAQTRGK